MIAYERSSDHTLVLAAGIPEAWVREAPGIRVRGLRTHYGQLDFSMCADGDRSVEVSLGGTIRCPQGGIVIESPYSCPLRAVVIDGRRSQNHDSRHLAVSVVAARIVLEY